jgi:hypothetical protein
MIEIIEAGSGFRWTFICNLGRVLAYSTEVYPSVDSAAAAAKAWRVQFWAVAAATDHRMAACI